MESVVNELALHSDSGKYYLFNHFYPLLFCIFITPIFLCSSYLLEGLIFNIAFVFFN